MLDPILDAGPAIQIHVVGALTAVVLAPVQFLRKRRDRLHKVMGYVWVLAMATTAMSSFLISGIRLVGAFSPIHLLSIYVLWGLFQSVRAANNKDIATHRETLQSMAFWGLGIAGLFTFLPGRLMNAMLFGQFQIGGFTLMLVLAFVVWQFVWRRPAWVTE